MKRTLSINPIVHVIATLVLISATNTIANENNWAPVVTDRLVRMDIQALDRELSKQFSGSSLALKQVRVDKSINNQAGVIGNLQGAIDSAPENAIKRRLQYREINERGALIKMLDERTSIRGEKAKADLFFYESLMSKMDTKNRKLTDQEKQLIESQTRALERMEATASTMDYVIDDSQYGSTKYNFEYALVQSDMQRLRSAIESHVSNTADTNSGVPLTKSEYLFQKIISAQSEYALALNEKKMVGLMAKLLALDAAALESDTDPIAGTTPEDEIPKSHANQVMKLFVN